MRILQACPYSWHAHGGVQEHIAQVSRALRRRGHEIEIVTPGEPGRDVEPGVTVVGWPVRVPFNGSVAPTCLERAAIARVRQRLQAFAPDVVHSHEPFSSMVTGAAARHARGPVVATFHCALDRPLDRALYRLVTRSLWWVERSIDVRLAVSPTALATARLATPSAPIAIMPNGVEAERFAGVRNSRFVTDEAVLFVGRLEARKGLHVLLAAMARLWRTRPQARLTIVGDGPERRLVEALPPEARRRVDLRGHCTRVDLLKHYAAARVVVAPSLRGESFGMALLDAMAAGRPVVASDIASYRRVLDDGRAGWLVPAGDDTALAAALASLLDDPNEAARLGRTGADWALTFDWDVIASCLEAVYDTAQRPLTAAVRRRVPAADRGAG